MESLSADDICVVLLSGGGSALLPAPASGLSLADKQAVTRLLMTSGTTIDELNCVRKHLSRIKGGNLARAAGFAQVVALIISDVVGDPLDVIASGPTVADPTTAADALAVLQPAHGAAMCLSKSGRFWKSGLKRKLHLCPPRHQHRHRK